MNKVTDWIKHHQISAFFITTFAISWGLGFSWGAVLKRDQALLLPLAFVAACGPGLAGIIISASPIPNRGKVHAKHSGLPFSWRGSYLCWFVLPT